ncbi:MAG: hypothetical protein E7523_09845 [Ruminococcaceae bacterium]|nr:hypothetical protein [Oscillospiraceae bacterium]
MAGYQSAEAYDFATFEPKDGSAARQLNNAQPVGEPLRKKNVRPNPNLKIVEPNARQAVKQQASVSAKKVFAVLFCCVMMFGFIAMFINNSVKSTELMNSINEMEVNIANAQSENVRLSSAIDSMFSIAKVENYATNVLGMAKMENYQIQYVDLSSDDQVLYAGEDSAFGGDLVERVTEYFNGLFA